MDELPVGSMEKNIESVNEVVQPEQPSQPPEREVKTYTHRVTQKQLDALAKGRALNIERRKKYIEFEKLQALQKLKVIEEPPQPPPIMRSVPVAQPSYRLSFV
jgi:hypothetical protein